MFGDDAVIHSLFQFLNNANFLFSVKNNSLGPTISINTSVVYAVQGERVTIDCQPLGIPTPEFAWVRPRSNAPSLPLSKENVLEIVDVQLSDEGRYVCRAWNRYGAAQANVELKVSSTLNILLPSVPCFTAMAFFVRLLDLRCLKLFNVLLFQMKFDIIYII